MQVDYIDLNWNFKEVVNNIEVIRTKTRVIIASFSSFEIKKQVKFKKQLRDKIYSFNFETWKKDRVVECIYDYFEIEKLQEMIK